MKRKQAKPFTEAEFLQHFAALPVVRKYQHVSRRFDGSSSEQMEIGDSTSYDSNVLRVMDYFSQVYSDNEEARKKASLFLVVLSHLAKYQDAYNTERFAVFTDSKQASMVSVPLLRAIHHHFTSCSLRDLPPEDELVESIKCMARKLAAEYDSQPPQT